MGAGSQVGCLLPIEKLARHLRVCEPVCHGDKKSWVTREETGRSPVTGALRASSVGVSHSWTSVWSHREQ